MQAVSRYQLRNQRGMEVTVLDYGATLDSIRVPVGDSYREVLLGCPTADDYPTQGAYLGATVGRYANRICHSRYQDQGQEVKLLSQPDQPHQLHGGPEGYSKRFWQVSEQTSHSICMTLQDEAGSQGFPGSVAVSARFSLSDDNQLTIEYSALPSQRTPISLTSHGYFNLDGKRSSCLEHKLQLNASHYMPVAADGAPQAELKAVKGAFDFRLARSIGSLWMSSDDQQTVSGFDHAFLIAPDKLDLSGYAAKATSADRRLSMEVYTTLPAMQLYTGNFLAGTPAREGDSYANYEGFCLEPGYIADTPNRPELGDCYYSPERPFKHSIVFRFM